VLSKKSLSSDFCIERHTYNFKEKLLKCHIGIEIVYINKFVSGKTLHKITLFENFFGED
jgi:hypothetical protein